MPEEFETAEAIFYRAIELDGQSREAFLAEACGGNRDLREQVDRLVGDHQRASDFLDKPAADVPTMDLPVTEQSGTRIGPYKLLQQIGEGGMGVVYMAEQMKPVERRVAVKIIKPGMDSRQVIARFEAERQALAMMDHPNIATVLDTGTTESGRPYFVMELVKGIPIVKYCDEHRLTPRERLELFVPVCRAVQHAHQKGIIHRDIKPTNVLVAEYDDQAVPKIIDFGVAKAIEQRLTEKTMFTQFGQVVGTVDYMSPEQAKLNQLDIDTRSDIYSLGVVLYELLTGETPFDRQRLRSNAFDEILRIIREEEPPKPSLRLGSSQSLPAVAANRQTEPAKLRSLIRGELDWIVMKAMEKDRTRRYETASSLGADVERFLNDDPVAACPPSAAYRFRKFARRNKAAMMTAAIVTASLVFGLFGTTWQAIQKEAARREYQAVLEDLWEVLTDRAIDTAFSGDPRQTREAIRKARMADAPNDVLQTLNGLSLLFDGREEEAVTELAKVRTGNPSSFLAHAALWSAYRYSADYGDMYQVEKSMRDRNLSPATDYDRLFQHLMEIPVVPAEEIDEVIESLGGLIEDHKRWGAAYAVRAVAWDERGREFRRLEYFRNAVHDVDSARSILQDSPLILTISLVVLTHGIEMAQAEGNSSDVQVWCEAGEEIRKKLERRPDCFMGRREVTVFCHVTGQTPRVQLTEDDLIEHNKGGWIIRTSKWMRKQDTSKLKELEKELRQKPDDVEALINLGLILAERSEHGREEAMHVFEKLQAMDGTPCGKVLALHIPLLMGRPEVARAASERLLASNVLAQTWREWTYVTEYHAGRMEEDELRLRAAPFDIEQQVFYHEIAMEALAVGNRHKAKEYFKKVVDTVQIGTWYYHSALMFLQRLEDNPTWPSWIEQNIDGSSR